MVAQVKRRLVARAAPNWSLAVAVNCCVPPAFRLTDAGLTAIAVSVWLTVTLTLLVAVNPAGVGDRDLEGIVARLAEGGRGVLGRVAAVGLKLTAAGGVPVVDQV